MTSVLIVEDEKHLANGLRFNLEAEGYSVEVVGDGESALERLIAAPERYDAVLLDVMLPEKDGFTVASELRKAGQFVPILMLTARGRSEDVLQGFESGADDYLAKPFELAILQARLRGLLRRSEWAQRRRAFGRLPSTPLPTSGSEGSDLAEPVAPVPEELYSFGGRTIDFGALELRTKAQTVRLTLMEAELLRYLIRHEGKVVSRKSMLEEVWDLREDTDTRAIDNFVVRLRKYIEDEPSKPRFLLTVRGVGYRFVRRSP